ncbi:hypothetical protein JCM9140_4412 [Halalkalibacter wakoensis JCM 9140]|uniref:Uncharacterized protein n=1 Tax=Halalkalibacter wakoensis JCM 9140 TaxID=1236970 RepID=W4Q888_9BACI|nr:hypothetical protein [Halalkalibacter wakoensis]GAE28202.1 hypothetical protein JCM9140_4412 [Halalkalibacter wakoensis JCM 9140]
MTNKNNKEFKMPSKTYSQGEIGMRTEVDPEHPDYNIDRYAGDSVDEHKELERANEDIAEKEIAQINENL